MKKGPHRNLGNPHRPSSWASVSIRKEQYYGLEALLDTWERQPADVQTANHDYIIALKARLRAVCAGILHRADPAANI